MATIDKFENLRVWQQARELSKWLFSLIQFTELKNDFKLRNQAESSIGSVMDNIAEGFERNGKREFINFLSIAKGSAGEFRSQLYRVYDREYLSKEILKQKIEEIAILSKGLSSFIHYLNNSELKGWKFKEPDSEHELKLQLCNIKL